MAQAMLRRRSTKEIAVQTGDLYEFFGFFSKTKTIRLYWSAKFREYIVSLHFSNNKKYIIRKNEWKRLKKFFTDIDIVFQ